ncbi:MAG: D-alanine--D-alanine ligase, partial [Desulfobacca sp.]|nr:D-alanine--D-alanine ligase [Desulfobacca sp.]
MCGLFPQRGYANFLESAQRTIRGEEIVVLETNTIPGMTGTRLLPQAAQAAGLTFSALLDQLIELALEGHTP